MNDRLFLGHKGPWWEWPASEHGGTRQHTPVFALKCRIKVCPIVRHASWPTPGAYCHRPNCASFLFPLWRSTLLLYVGRREWKRDSPLEGFGGGFGGRGGGWVLVIMKEQARMTNNGSPGLWSRQRQCCSNYSANTAALCVHVCVCVLTCGSGAEGIALLAAVSQGPDYFFLSNKLKDKAGYILYFYYCKKQTNNVFFRLSIF